MPIPDKDGRVPPQPLALRRFGQIPNTDRRCWIVGPIGIRSIEVELPDSPYPLVVQNRLRKPFDVCAVGGHRPGFTRMRFKYEPSKMLNAAGSCVQKRKGAPLSGKDAPLTPKALGQRAWHLAGSHVGLRR